jgi:hypothetical protein
MIKTLDARGLIERQPGQPAQYGFGWRGRSCRIWNRTMGKPTGWVVDMRHYIDEDTGDLPEVIPERVLSLAIFFGAIVAWVTDHLPEGDEHTNVPCRRSPGRRRCRGDIVAQLDRSSGYIVWQCPLCGDHGMIHGWEDTLWNRDAGAPQSMLPPSTARH